MNADGSINAEAALAKQQAVVAADGGFVISYDGMEYPVMEVLASDVDAALFELRVRNDATVYVTRDA